MIFDTSCMLNGSPGPIPGAPKKGPAVDVASPKPALVLHGAPGVDVPQLMPSAPIPWDKLMRLKRLYISARGWIFSRAVIGMFWQTDKSTAAYHGRYNCC